MDTHYSHKSVLGDVDSLKLLPSALQKVVRQSVDFPKLKVATPGIWRKKGVHLANPVMAASDLSFRSVSHGLSGLPATGFKKTGIHLGKTMHASNLRLKNVKSGLSGLGQVTVANLITSPYFIVIGGLLAFYFVGRKYI